MGRRDPGPAVRARRPEPSARPEAGLPAAADLSVSPSGVDILQTRVAVAPGGAVPVPAVPRHDSGALRQVSPGSPAPQPRARLEHCPLCVSHPLTGRPCDEQRARVRGKHSPALSLASAVQPGLWRAAGPPSLDRLPVKVLSRLAPAATLSLAPRSLQGSRTRRGQGRARRAPHV